MPINGIMPIEGIIMSDQEKSIRELEAKIPLASGAAFTGAYQQALLSGQSLVQTIGHAVYEVHPDGTMQLVKELEQPIYVEPGTRVKIR